MQVKLIYVSKTASVLRIVEIDRRQCNTTAMSLSNSETFQAEE